MFSFKTTGSKVNTSKHLLHSRDLQLRGQEALALLYNEFTNLQTTDHNNSFTAEEDFISKMLHICFKSKSFIHTSVSL